MRLIRPLDDLLSSPAKVALMRVMCQVQAPLAGREAIRRAGLPFTTGWRALQALAAAGVLVRTDHGKVVTFRLPETGPPLLAKLRELFAEEDRRRNAFALAVAERFPGLLSAHLFGSEARGQATTGSDTDLLIVVESRNAKLDRQLQRVAGELGTEYGLTLSAHVADLDTVHTWETEDHPFWREIRRDGVRIAGDSLQELMSRWRKLGGHTSNRL